MIEERAAELRDVFKGRLTIGTGCDMHLSYENVQEAIKRPNKFTINGGRYLLVEFADSSIPPRMTDVLYQLRVAGMIPIITHPERNPILARSEALLKGFLREGCLIQITAGALTGRFGPGAEMMARRWIGLQWVHAVASDAHGVRWRGPQMAKAHEVIQRQFGEETADRLCTRNPRAVFLNTDLPKQPSPIEIDNDPHPARRGLLDRLFKGH